jgi:hypothetical protein
MVIDLVLLIPFTIPWDGKKSSTIVKGKYVDSVDIYRPAAVPVEFQLQSDNDNEEVGK